MQEKIKKTLDHNEYVLSDNGIWVRNFFKLGAPPSDINNLTKTDEFSLFIANEVDNSKKRFMEMVPEIRRKIVIVSDGYDFANKHLSLKNTSADVCVITVNKALSKWKLVGDNAKEKKPISYYVINNPYPQAISFIPKNNSYYPKCIASIRTNPDFIRNYKGTIFTYNPVSEGAYRGHNSSKGFTLDDYRNPICAAIGLTKYFSCEKVLLLCCDDSFKDERPGAEQLDNGLWQYPQQYTSNCLVDANLYWAKNSGIKVANFSSGRKLKNAEYINDEARMLEFLKS